MPSPRKTKAAGKASRALRVLGVLVIALGVLTIALFIVQYNKGVTAGKASDALLVAFEATPTPVPTDTPEPTATPDPGPAVTDLAVDEDGEVDETADYVQMERPDEEGDVQALIQKIIHAEGEDGVIGLIEIPELDVKLPIIGKWSYPLLKISICRYSGPLPNEKGNMVLIGHNYKNGSHFGKLDKLKKGAAIFITDTKTSTRVRYEVYEIKTIAPTDFKALETFKGPNGLTLLTCINGGNDRQIFRCIQKDAP